MSQSLDYLVIAADPLLRKAVTETLTGMYAGARIEAISPTRVTPVRLAAAEVTVLAAYERDLATLEPTITAIKVAGCPTLLVAAGLGDDGRSVTAKLRIPSEQGVAIPELNIRDELFGAAPKLEAALRCARMQSRKSPERVTSNLGKKPVERAPVRARAENSPSDAAAPYLGLVICIGSSTGGTDALLAVLSGMSKDCPPIVIVQHMPEDYVGDFAQRLDQSCAINVKLAEDKLALRRGLAVLAPGGRQFRLRKDTKGIWTALGENERVGGHNPAVNVMMKSASEELGKSAIGVILTGMGRDGAEGLLAMRRAGARTLAQDEATSVVYGMPKAAAEEGAADTVMALPKISGWISGLTFNLKH